MAESFRLSVVTAGGTVFEDSVDYVNIPTGFGSLGILANHAPMLCAVEKGVLRCRQEGKTLRLRVGAGVASVGNNEVTLLLSDAQIEE